MHGKTVVVNLMALFFLASVSAFGADKTEVKGMITSRTGETLIVKSGGTTTTVVLTDSTRTKDDRGLFGLEKQEMSNAVLIPGLKVDIDGTSDDQGRFIAKTITVDGDDLEAAEMIQSGLHPTAQQSKPTSKISPLTNKKLKRTSRTSRRTLSALSRCPNMT